MLPPKLSVYHSLVNCTTATIDNRTLDFHRPGCAASATRRSSPPELPETHASAPYLNRARQTLLSRVDVILDPKLQLAFRERPSAIRTEKYRVAEIASVQRIY